MKTAQKLLTALGVVALGIVLVCFIVSKFSEDDENRTPEQKKAESAYFAAVKFCEQYAPSSTKITTDNGGDYLDGRAEIVTNYVGKTEWMASGYIDCDNLFGAMRHRTWAAHVSEEGSDWRLTFLRIGNEQMIGGD